MVGDSGFEWFVAWRHLRDPERRSRRALGIGLVILLLGLLTWVAAWILSNRTQTDFFSRPSLLVERLKMAGAFTTLLGGVISFLGLLFARFTFFTAISIFGVFIGTAAPILALSVMSGFELDLKGKIRGAKADAVITATDDHPFNDAEAVLAKIAKVPGVVAATAFVEGEVMLRSGTTPAGAFLRGIDVRTVSGVVDVKRSLREGDLSYLEHPESFRSPQRRWPTPTGIDLDEKKAPAQAKESEPDEPVLPLIFLGEELYSRGLRVFQGSTIDIVCPLCGSGPMGAMPKQRTFRVAGHFYTGMYEFDSKLSYVSLSEAQRFLGMPGEITGIDLRVQNPDHVADVAVALRAVLGPALEVRTWEDLNRGLFLALRLEKVAMFIVLAFIALVASFSVVATLIMLATEKGREIAILKAMGARDGAIVRIFLIEGLYIGFLGLLVGVGAGVLGCLLIKWYGLPLPQDVYYISKLPIVMRPAEILTVAGLALGLCCLATIYPAYLASRLRPADGLRYE